MHRMTGKRPFRIMAYGYSDADAYAFPGGANVVKIRDLVASKQAASISAFVQHAVDVALADVAGWATMLAGALEQTGGPLTKAERTWAEAIVFPPSRKKLRRRRKAA